MCTIIFSLEFYHFIAPMLSSCYCVHSNDFFLFFNFFYSLFIHVDSNAILLSQFSLHLVHDIWWIELNRTEYKFSFNWFSLQLQFNFFCFNPRFSLWVCVCSECHIRKLSFISTQGFFSCGLAETLPQVYLCTWFRGNFNRMPQKIINSSFQVCTLYSTYVFVCFLLFSFVCCPARIWFALFRPHHTRNWNAMRINEWSWPNSIKEQWKREKERTKKGKWNEMNMCAEENCVFYFI